MMKKNLKIIGILLLTLFLCSCGKNQSSPKVEEPKKEIEKPRVQIVDEESNTRPIAVMINNISDARKVQSGLSKAYMVYELNAEGGITRYLALFKDIDELKQIGSVRSSRHYYLDYVLENDAIYVHWGWSPQAQEDIKALKINNINGIYDSAYFYRSNPLNLATEHTGFTTMEKIQKAIEKKGYRKTTDKGLLLKYSAEEINLEDYGTVTSATKVEIDFSKTIKNTYKYNEENKVYTKYVNSKLITDYNTGEELNIKNVIAYKVPYTSIKGDDKGRQLVENIGEGKGYLFTEGKAIEIKWKKEKRASKTKYYYENGEELIVNDGQTFIQIVPTSGSISME